MKKMDFIKKYSGILLVVVFTIIFYKLSDSLYIYLDFFSNLLNILSPVFLGSVLAYFLSPIAIKLENLLKKNKGFLSDKARLLSVLIVFFGFIAIIILSITMVFPVIMDAIIDLSNSLSDYVKNATDLIDEYIQDPQIAGVVASMQDRFVTFINELASSNPLVYIQSVFSAASSVFQIILGFVFCPYILIERNRLGYLFDQILLFFMSEKRLKFIHHYAKASHTIFGSFVYGKFIDSLVIGIIAAFGFWLLDLPAFLLLAIIIFVTNMIPYFGPFIGGVPVIIFVFISGDVMGAVWTTLFIFALQQFDGLILGPAILGETVGISPFWIILAITLFGGLWGFVGMFIGVPLICIIRLFFNDYLTYRNNKLKKPIVEE